MQELKKLIKLAKLKHQIDTKRDDDKFMNFDWNLNNIVLEVDEVRQEIKPNNTPYLEDELSDILWGWIVMVEKLKSSKYVDSHEGIHIPTLNSLF